MIDFHSHILPNMDDGSKSLEESLDMLNMASSQGIGTIVATPHFYRANETVESFLKRRAASVESLNKVLAAPASMSNTLPNILTGAEVSFFPGISRNCELEKLCIQNSRCLLLEMPFERWSSRILNEVCNLLTASGRIIIIAHVERYLFFPNHHKNICELLGMGALMQINTSSFKDFRNRSSIIKLLKLGDSFILGTDCHNTTTRPPEIHKACGVIKKKFGLEKLQKMELLSELILQRS